MAPDREVLNPAPAPRGTDIRLEVLAVPEPRWIEEALDACASRRAWEAGEIDDTRYQWFFRISMASSTAASKYFLIHA